jgi:four helix bundle protein
LSRQLSARPITYSLKLRAFVIFTFFLKQSKIVNDMRDFTKLEVWKRSHLLTLKIYQITKLYPKEELFSQTSQMRRSASSIPTNIAEGCGRNTNPQLKHFFEIAAGSSSELQYQLILSKDLEYISESTFQELHDETIQVRKMIYAYSNQL